MTSAVSRQSSVCLGSSLSMRSFAIDEPGSSVRALYATLCCANNRQHFYSDLSTNLDVEQVFPDGQFANEGVPACEDHDGSCGGFHPPQHAEARPWAH